MLRGWKIITVGIGLLSVPAARDYIDENSSSASSLKKIVFLPLAKRISGDQNWKTKADTMVENQVRVKGITDARVLQAMKNTPRHLFVPKNYSEDAYDNRQLPIGAGQTISTPFTVALMTELLQLKNDDTVLEIGTGSGYQSAILAQLATKVYSIELMGALADSADSRLKKLGYDNVKVKQGDGYLGWKEHAPFNTILLTCAPKDIPQELVEQLKDGGRMVLPLGINPNQELVVITKHGNEVITEKKCAIKFVPMIHPKN